MKKNTVILLWIFIIAVILLSTPLKCNPFNKFYNSNDTVEPFYTNYGYYKRYCSNCGHRSRASCSKCTTCGFCLSYGRYADGSHGLIGECTTGDASGPYFRADCAYWEYGDPYYYAPYGNIFSNVQTKSIYPHLRYRTRRPYRWRKRLGRRKRRARSKK